MEAGQLTAWIQAFLGLLHSAAGSDDFYDEAARALVDLVRLDSGRVLFRVGPTWQEKVVQTGSRLALELGMAAEQPGLANVLREKKTFWQVPDLSGARPRGIDAVVAAPILDRHGRGHRRPLRRPPADSAPQASDPISQLEAMLVEVLASGVAAGLARLEQEQAALRARLQMEQFFTPASGGQARRASRTAAGRDTMVSVLFCDIRGFSRISEQLGPAKTVEWIVRRDGRPDAMRAGPRRGPGRLHRR